MNDLKNPYPIQSLVSIPLFVKPAQISSESNQPCSNPAGQKIAPPQERQNQMPSTNTLNHIIRFIGSKWYQPAKWLGGIWYTHTLRSNVGTDTSQDGPNGTTGMKWY